MKILIDMPPEFETDYVADRFAEFFDRVKADMSICCGEYEKEIADMLKKAFAESEPYAPELTEGFDRTEDELER